MQSALLATLPLIVCYVSLVLFLVLDSLDKSLPDGFYNKRAMLYIMDVRSERFVLKPKGMGERSAGHLSEKRSPVFDMPSVSPVRIRETFTIV